MHPFSRYSLTLIALALVAGCQNRPIQEEAISGSLLPAETQSTDAPMAPAVAEKGPAKPLKKKTKKMKTKQRTSRSNP